MSQSSVYSQTQAKKANLTLERLGLASWEKPDVIALQTKVGAKPADGWFGPGSIKTWKAWAKKHDTKPVQMPTLGSGYLSAPMVAAPYCAIVNGESHLPPMGVTVVNFVMPNGIPAQLDDTDVRKYPVTQFVLHRGAENHMKGENYAQATERILDARGLSTTFSMDIDGVIYQHFDPALRRGRHASHHNVQSDSLDIGGPFVQRTTKPKPGQVPLTLKMAIGRENDNKPPMTRGYADVKCWSLPPAQVQALALFLPWWCALRGIPVTACSDWRTFRLGGAGIADPVTNVKGILAHCQISGPGQRVDGILPLHHLKEVGAPIAWRAGVDFFNA